MFEDRGWQFYLDEGAGGGAGGGDAQGAGPAAQQAQQPLQYDAWIAGQPDEVKSLVDGHITGLKTALGTERERNKTLEKDLREAASKADKGSENEKRLTQLANQVAETSRKAGFYESAVTAGVLNVKLAYIAAVNDDLFKKDGSVDFDGLKKGYPELFGSRTQSNNAGTGGNGQKPGTQTMDAYIRAKLGG